jgi:F0F1-type ATP synthase assembly protein I
MIEIPGSTQGRKQPEREPWKVNLPFGRIAKYLAIGLEFPSTIAGALILGHVIDSRFGTSPWCTVGAAILGFIGAVYRLIRYLEHFSRHDDQS